MVTTNNKGVLITGIEPGSIAEELGITTGYRMVSINGTSPDDILDYRFLCADEDIQLTVVDTEGEIHEADIEKEIYENLGFQFSSPVFDRVKTCCLDCRFCFVKQMPPGMRKSLYYRDDDYRLSFLHGNFM